MQLFELENFWFLSTSALKCTWFFHFIFPQSFYRPDLTKHLLPWLIKTAWVVLLHKHLAKFSKQSVKLFKQPLRRFGFLSSFFFFFFFDFFIFSFFFFFFFIYFFFFFYFFFFLFFFFFFFVFFFFLLFLFTLF